MGIDMTIEMTVYVKEEIACIIDIVSAQAVIKPQLNNLDLSLTLDSFSINDIQVVHAETKTFNVNDIKNFINVLARIAIPFVNMKLSKNIVKIPSEFFGAVRVKDATLKAMDGYIQVGIVPEFF
jgi:hypothetical protein